MRELDQYNEATSHAHQNEIEARQFTEENDMNNTTIGTIEMSNPSTERPTWAATKELNAALAKARTEIQNPELDSVNPHFQSKFSSLTAVINSTIPILAKHGIAVIQEVESRDGGVYCYTTLLHESGEERTSRPLFIPVTKMDAQGTVSATTYGRRVQLATIIGVAGEVEDDGNRASKPVNEKITKEQAVDLACLIEEVGANRPAFLKACHINSEDELPANMLAGAIARLERKRETPPKKDVKQSKGKAS